MTRVVLGLWMMGVVMVAPVWAQSATGVSVALVEDIRRAGGVDGSASDIGNGEALTFALRVDQALGSRWGVELEYVRGGEIEFDQNVGIPVDFSQRAIPPSFAGASLSGILTPVPPINFRSTAKARRSAVSSLAWYRQPLGTRTSLVYSAGIAFLIDRMESSFEVVGLPVNVIPRQTTVFRSYAAAPIVGVDARIAMTDHASLVPGVRVIASSGTVLIRPAIGLRWQF